MGKFELIDNFHSVPITKEGRPQLKNYSQKFPLGREVHRSITMAKVAFRALQSMK